MYCMHGVQGNERTLREMHHILFFAPIYVLCIICSVKYGHGNI